MRMLYHVVRNYICIRVCWSDLKAYVLVDAHPVPAPLGRAKGDAGDLETVDGESFPFEKLSGPFWCTEFLLGLYRRLPPLEGLCDLEDFRFIK